MKLFKWEIAQAALVCQVISSVAVLNPKQANRYIWEDLITMLFVQTFKGFEDEPMDLDRRVNNWIRNNSVSVRNIRPTLSHEFEAEAGSGDLLYTVTYKADKPIACRTALPKVLRGVKV